MGLWVLGQILLSVCIFVGVYIGLSLLGVQYALVLALLAGVFEVVPFIGPTLSAIPALFIAFTQSPTLAIAVLVLYIAVQKLESWILVPKIMQKTVGTSPVVIIFALLIGVKLGGIVGLLLAVPIVAIFTVLKEEWKG
jgi:predicted PurR-regulated permease PerM